MYAFKCTKSHLRVDAELAFMEIRHSYSTFPLKTAVPYPTYPTNGSVPDLVIDNRSLLIDH